MAASTDEVSTKDDRRLLVVACGRRCADHPHERWVSLDRLAEQNPDILIDVEDLTPQHFDAIKARKEFDLIYMEGISNTDAEGILKRLNVLNQFIAPDGILVVSGCGLDSFSDCPKFNFQLGFFILNAPFQIIAKDKTSLESLKDKVSVITQDLLNRMLPESRANLIENFNRITTAMQTVQSQNPLLPLRLVSIIAHLDAYIEGRKSRPLRNWLRDNEYKRRIEDIKKAVIEYASGSLSQDELISQLTQLKMDFPSRKLNTQDFFKKIYHNQTKLSWIIDACIQVLAIDSSVVPTPSFN